MIAAAFSQLILQYSEILCQFVKNSQEVSATTTIVETPIPVEPIREETIPGLSTPSPDLPTRRKNIRESKLKASDQLLFESNNPSKTAWKLINRARNSEEVENSTITPDQFNDYFINIAAEIHSKVLSLGNTHSSSSSIQYQQESIFLTPTHLSEVKSTINNLKNTKSMDIYGLNPELIKTALPVIAEPYTLYIFYFYIQ
ncbi:hypothetical protein CBL_10571 [Carabus blaptoides fortunei]